MVTRREQLVHLMEQRRRRTRLLLACATVAVACGFLAISLGPRMLIGAAQLAPASAATAGQAPAGVTGQATTLLALSDELRLDPREAQANLIRWSGMSEAERRTLVARYWHLASLDPADRDRIIEKYAAFRDLPESRQEALRNQARKLHEFTKSLSPQDQAMLESMNDRDRAERLLELWQARHKTW
ncbi:MAG: DUF3106 domain-containing protein [Planctomycetota bacterium]|nr:DUF3106 domain-containing protein [Planctomycetota bacterium]